MRQSFQQVLHTPFEEVHLIYDFCHNIAKIETHEVEGKKKQLCVHRKGATRAFGSGTEDLPPLYQSTGQPVLVPGDMGRANYLMAGLGNPLTWCSSCHGARKERSRVHSRKAWHRRGPIAHMEQRSVLVRAASHRAIVEEMPDAYKDVHNVVHAVEEAKLAKKVARLRPEMVVKG